MASGDTTWRDSLLIAPGRIAGVRVRPLSAWHCHVAQMLDVRLGVCEDGRGPTPGDVAAAIAICRSVYRPGVPGVPVAGRLLRAYLRVRWALFDWRRDAQALVAHVDAYRRYPEIVRQPGKEGQPIGCPPHYAIAVEIVSQVASCTLADALNMPLPSLYCLRAALAEMGGGPACAWKGMPADDEIQAALQAAQLAIDKLNAKEKAVLCG